MLVLNIVGFSNWKQNYYELLQYDLEFFDFLLILDKNLNFKRLSKKKIVSMDFDILKPQ